MSFATIAVLVMLGLIIKYWDLIVILFACLVLFLIVYGIFGSRSRHSNHSSFRHEEFTKESNVDDYESIRRELSASRIQTSNLRSYGNYSTTPLSQKKDVRSFVVQNGKNTLDGIASCTCFSQYATHVESYEACIDWELLYVRYANFIRVNGCSSCITLKYSASDIQRRKEDIELYYKSELIEMNEIRENLKSYFTAHPFGLRKDAVSAFIQRSEDPEKYKRYYGVIGKFEHSMLLAERSVDGALHYTYIGKAVSEMLEYMKTAPQGKKRTLMRSMKFYKDKADRKVYGKAYAFMERTNMIESSKDEDGNVMYTFLMNYPREFRKPKYTPEYALGLVRSSDEYMIDKALHTVNVPVSLDSKRRNAVFLSLSSSETYYTTLCSCTCPAFTGSQSPCKHIVRLSIELGFFMPPGRQNRYCSLPELGFDIHWFTDYM